MFNIEKIELNLSFSGFYLALCIVLIIAYSIFVYRFTIPPVNKFFKYFLIATRIVALALILFAIFEPALTITRKKNITPVNLLFIDNSKSIQIKDGTNREEKIKGFVNEAERSGLFSNQYFYSFGNKIKLMNFDSLSRFNFTEAATNFIQIVESIRNDDNNIASISIVSDGVITDGVNPLYQAEKSGIPVFTVGIGDTLKKNNIEIKKVISNEYIYTETPTTINLSILNHGYKNQTVVLNMLEDNRIINQQNISLSNQEETTASLTYSPKKSGEKKLTFTISELKGESSYADNKKSIYVNVLSSRINVLLIAGSLSADLSFIKNSLSSDPNLNVSSITQIAQNRFLENADRNRLIDSADVLYLIGFPSAQTPDGLLNKVFQSIQNKNKPFFIITSSGTDYNRLRSYQAELPFTIKSIATGSTEVQPNIAVNEIENPLLKSNAQNIIESWNNLPPVYKDNVEFIPKPESNILAKIKINNIPMNSPLILSRKLGAKKSMAVLAKDIWKWKLQTAEKKLDLFDRFIYSGTKWMNTKEDQKNVTIRTSKKIYSLGEQVDFTAQVYNETMNPVDDAEINIAIKSLDNNFNISLNSLGGGIYEGTLITTKIGDYRFDGTAKLKGKALGNDYGKFSISDVEIEFINPGMDKDFLNLLSTQTGGKFFLPGQSSQLFDLLRQIDNKKSSIKLVKSKFILWSNEWLLIIVILLFGVEWFFRKRSGMI